MVKAEKLDYPTIIDALEKGHFYASSGPEIYELYYEDGKVHISCSEAQAICMYGLGRIAKGLVSKKGETWTEATFELDPQKYGFVRFVVTDPKGKKAFTNAYYVDEFIEGAGKRRVVL